MKSPRPWTVLPHGPFVALGSNLKAVEGHLPSGHVPRRMMVARRADGRLLFFNAVPLAEPAMRELEAFGSPSFLVVPNGFHRLDIHAFKERYPGVLVLCPTAVREAVAAKVTVGGSIADFPDDPIVRLVPARGTKIGEPILFVRGEDGSTAVGFGDRVMNLPSVAGFDGFLFKLLGSVGGPRVTAIARMLMLSDRSALREHLLELAGLPGLRYLVPTHGEIVSEDASGVLRKVAERL